MKVREDILKFSKQYKGFFIVCIIEIIIILFLAGVSVFRDKTEITLNADNLIIYDSKVEVIDYEPVDSMMLDENTLVVYDNKETTDIEKSLYVTGRNDEETSYRTIIGSDVLSVEPGVYEFEVRYYSLLYDNEVGGNSDDSTANIEITSKNNESCINYNSMQLNDNVTIKSERVWIRSLKSVDDLEIKVNFTGLGDFRLDSITLKEIPTWRFLKLLGWLLAFIIGDILYLYIFADNKYKNKNTVAALVAISIFSCLPVFTNYLLKGHDMDFHVARIWAIAENIKAGQMLFPIQTEMANGYGYASPIFYGQVFLYIPAIIYSLGAPIQICFQLYVAAVNIATVIISYLSFKGIVKDKRLAVLGSCLYTLSAYRITNVYLRSAVGEYTAMLFYPLLIYGFAAIYSKKASKIGLKECLAIVAGLTGLIQSHVLSCELAAIFIVLFCILAIKKTFEPKRFVMLFMTVIATLLVNLSFLVPFLASMGMHIRVNEQETENIQKYGTYLIQVLGVFMTSSGDTVDGMANEMPIALGFALVIGICCFIWCCINKYKWNITGDKRLRLGAVCTGFATAGIVISTRFFPWDGLGKINPVLGKILSVVQFPWRYLSVATVFAVTAAIVGADIMAEHISKNTLKLIIAALLSFTVIQTGLFYTNFANSASEYKVYGGADVEQDTVGGEYMITGTIEGYMRWRSIKTDLANVGIADYKSDHGVITFICDNISDEEKLVEIPILNYDNYHAYTADGTRLAIENGENNRLGIRVPSGYNGYIRVQYEIPLLWTISKWISAISVLAIIIAVIMLNRRKKNGL